MASTRALAGLALLLSSCGSSPCTVAGRLSVSSNAVDCGTLDFTSGATTSASEAQAAQSCVLTAVAANAAFKIVWTSSDQLGPTTEAYVSNGLDTLTYHLLSQASFDSATDPNVREWTCGSITATTGCTVNGGDFCLSCTAETTETQLCGDSS